MSGIVITASDDPNNGGSTVSINSTTGEISINGVATGFFAVSNNTSTGTGNDGDTPVINASGNWEIGGTDTGVKAAGVDGDTPVINASGNWEIGGTDTGVKAATATLLEQAQANGHTGTDEAELWALILSGSSVDVANQFYLDAVSEGYTGNEAQFSAAIQQIIADSMDTTPPVITLNGASTINLDEGDTYTELGATTDDGSTVIIDSSNVDTANAGSYTVTYNATDASGNVAIEVTRTVIVSAVSTGTGETATADDDVIIGFGAYGTGVLNTLSSNEAGNLDITLLNNLGVDSGLRLDYTVVGASGTPGDSVNTGLSYGLATTFDKTLKNDEISNHSTYISAGNSLRFEISGFTPNTAYKMQFMGSRTSSQNRLTEIDANGVVGSYNPAADPIEDPIELVVTSDGSGLISVNLTATLGDYAYIGGLLIKL